MLSILVILSFLHLFTDLKDLILKLLTYDSEERVKIDQVRHVIFKLLIGIGAPLVKAWN